MPWLPCNGSRCLCRIRHVAALEGVASYIWLGASTCQCVVASWQAVMVVSYLSCFSPAYVFLVTSLVWHACCETGVEVVSELAAGRRASSSHTVCPEGGSRLINRLVLCCLRVAAVCATIFTAAMVGVIKPVWLLSAKIDGFQSLRGYTHSITHSMLSLRRIGYSTSELSPFSRTEPVQPVQPTSSPL